MPGPDLPTPQQPMTVEAFLHRWPTSTFKTELINGVLVFSGVFDERDVIAVERTYPGRRALLDADGSIEVHPAGAGKPIPLVDTREFPSAPCTKSAPES
ncbi:hypothetical protein [Streptomyces sp. PA03-2a]|uniref:hypothetical protein n=1 Tax=Streptomyces sp. PA03-2a TaxID=3028701 RepID=UPI0029B42DDB|nr:hypothetical protein [Streptomyces sp. PA03-2a]MDX2728029.1 hypothetical protein [Streptomyces sp. PA03-2a]